MSKEEFDNNQIKKDELISNNDNDNKFFFNMNIVIKIKKFILFYFLSFY
jgi:hypothetical protein